MRIQSFILLALLLSLTGFSAGSYPEENNNNTISPAALSSGFKKCSYQTSISAFGRTISGITYFKPTNDNRYRVVLINEIGLTLIDLIVAPDSVTIEKCQEFLNKPGFINLMGTSYQTLLYDVAPVHNYREKNAEKTIVRYSSRHSRYRLSVNPCTHHVENATITYSLFHRLRIHFFYDPEDALPRQIKLRHKGIPVQISLTRLTCFLQ